MDISLKEYRKRNKVYCLVRIGHMPHIFNIVKRIQGSFLCTTLIAQGALVFIIAIGEEMMMPALLFHANQF